MPSDNRTCLSWWFPRIKDVVPVPRTEIFQIDARVMMCVMEYHELLARNELHKIGTEFVVLKSREDACACLDEFNQLVGKLKDATTRIPGPPWFLRTGQGSGKHEWKDCCYLTDPAKLAEHINALVNWSMLVDFIGLATNVWVLREYLFVKPEFFCKAYGGMPVVRELRVFVEDGDVAYHAPYWPEEALAQGKPNVAGWRKKLPKVQEFGSRELMQIYDLASKAGKACGGRWSVDVLDTEAGWYVTDMAEAHKSYGYDAARFDGVAHAQ